MEGLGPSGTGAINWDAPRGRYFAPGRLAAPAGLLASSTLKQCRAGQEVYTGAFRFFNSVGRRESGAAAGQFEVGDLLVLPGADCGPHPRTPNSLGN